MSETYASAKARLTPAVPPCVICSHPERDAIEQERLSGASYAFIARVLTRMGAFDGGLSERSATCRVRLHFDDHDVNVIAWG